MERKTFLLASSLRKSNRINLMPINQTGTGYVALFLKISVIFLGKIQFWNWFRDFQTCVLKIRVELCINVSKSKACIPDKDELLLPAHPDVQRYHHRWREDVVSVQWGMAKGQTLQTSSLSNSVLGYFWEASGQIITRSCSQPSRTLSKRNVGSPSGTAVHKTQRPVWSCWPWASAQCLLFKKLSHFSLAKYLKLLPWMFLLAYAFNPISPWTLRSTSVSAQWHPTSFWRMCLSTIHQRLIMI